MFEPLNVTECCGCMTCVNICPKDVIAWKRDKMGFSYPVVSYPDKCIHCNKCNDLCPNKREWDYSINVGEVLCAYNHNKQERLFSSSGGIFPLLCKSILRQGGVCYGVSFQEDFQPHHVRIDHMKNLQAILSSKYAESKIGYIYRLVKNDLKENKLILFSGTPCQIYGLKHFLGRTYDNLLLIDLFCYGIPSPTVWQKWIQYVSAGRTPVFVDFRDKSRGWDNYSLKMVFSDGSLYCEPKASDLYIATFSKGAFIRKSCYQCKLKAFPRASDITLGDFQELGEIFPEADPFAGWSMVRLNTEKGRTLFESISDQVKYTVAPAEIMDSVHPGIGSPSPKHPHREELEKHIDDLDVNTLLKRYATLTFRMKLRQHGSKVKKIIKNSLSGIA